MKKYDVAVFGGGCFWCTEAIFKSLKGIISVIPGYAGGAMKNPSYQDVSSGETGHVEVVQITFDPEVIPYEDLLDVFWNTHNPTTLNQQGNDVGTQYRSFILYTTPDQKMIAEKSRDTLNASSVFQDRIVTEIHPLTRFYKAERYHQDYYTQHRGEPYCELIISPKLQHLQEKYAKKLI